MSKLNELKVAVMWNGRDLKVWQKNALVQLFSVPEVKPILYISPADGPPVPAKKPGFIYRIFKRFTDPESMKNTGLPEYPENIPVLKLQPEKVGKFRERFSNDDLDHLKKFSPDVIIRFGFNILEGDILTLPKYGIWSYHHGDPHHFRGGPPVFWEMNKRKNTSGAILQRITERLDCGLILHKGTFSIDKHSFRSTLNEVLTISSGWLRQAALELIHNGRIKESVVVSEGPLTTYPGNTDVLRNVALLCFERFKFYFGKYFLTEDWAVGRVDQKAESVIKGEKLKEPFWITASNRSSYLADPFVFHQDNTSYLICEEYSYYSGKGRIITERLLSPTGKTTPVLDDTFHRSYPYTFHHSGESYLLTEAAESTSLNLYKLTNDGLWENDAILLSEFPAVDPSIVYYKGKWWLFCTRGEGKASNRDLYIFHSADLKGPFIPHILNPVKSDVGSARPGGSVLFNEGNLIRVAQDSSDGYGSRIHLMQVDELTETSFHESVLRTIEPLKKSRYNRGIHTLSDGGIYILIDGKRLIFRFSGFLLNLRRLFSRK